MAIDRVTGKRKLKVDKLVKEREEKEKKALPKFDVTYEEELIKSLFEEDIKKKEIAEKNTETIEDVEENKFCHHARPGEE